MIKRPFWLLVAASFILQFVLSFFETYGDVPSFFVPWAQTIERGNLQNFYDKAITLNTVPNYPPLIIYTLTLFHYLGTLILKPFLGFLWWLNLSLPFFPSKIVTFFNRDNLVIFSFIKLPNILANLTLSVGIYFLVKKLLPKKTNSKLPEIVLVSSLFNPALIFLSALWGQVDVMPFMFVVWSFYFLLDKRFLVSVFLMTLAVLTKQTALLAIPFYIFMIIRNLNIKRCLQAAAIVYITYVAFFWPFQKTLLDKLFPFIRYAKIASSFASNYVSMHAHNFWQMVMPGMKDNGVRLISQILVFGFLSFVLYRLWKKRNDMSRLMAGYAVFSLFSFVFMTRVHERHSLVVIPFFLIASVLDFRFYWIFVFQSFYLLANMYAAWPIPKIVFLEKALNSAPVVNIIIAIQICVLVYGIWIFYKKTYGTTENK